MKTKITSAKFISYQDMSQSAKNWQHHCAYRLLPNAFHGEHSVIELPNMQLSYSSRKGGFMHDCIPPCNSISIAVIQECSDRACFDRFKLSKGMVLFFDDSKAFNYMSKGYIRVAIISIPKYIYKNYDFELSLLLGSYLMDKNYTILTLLESIKDNSKDIEDNIVDILGNLIQREPLQTPKLTKGEEIALSIRNQVYHHMDGKINIKNFALQYNISEQTLQNSFKSLFGFTPKRFLQLLKLNLVHHDLQKSDPKEYTVTRVALKWGFSHMGRFSQEYTKLFRENPSQTLKSLEYIRGNMIQSCTSRKEEIE